MGLLCGCLFWGMLADKWGRVPSIVMANLLPVGATAAAAFMPTWQYFSLCSSQGSSCGLAGPMVVFVLRNYAIFSL